MASIAVDDALILPHCAKSPRVEFSGTTGRRALRYAKLVLMIVIWGTSKLRGAAEYAMGGDPPKVKGCE